MPLNWKTGKIKPSKPVTLRSNLGLTYSFTPGAVYEVKDITARPNGVDFSLKTIHFRDIDFNNKGIQFVD